MDLDLTPIYRFAASGLLEDLYQWMDNDPQFERTSTTPISSRRWKHGGGTSFLPFAFTFSPIYLNQIMISKMGVDVEEEYPDGLGLRDLVDLTLDRVFGWRTRRPCSPKTRTNGFSMGMS